ncbi:MAG: FKBP-type peptidyl-prolyl cis-trans isomerase FklB [Verrucomicrobiota bacterium]
MKNAFRIILVAGLGIAVLQHGTARAADNSSLKDTKEKVSYGIGMQIGNNLKQQGYDVDVDVLAGAIKDAVAGKEMKLTEQESREVLQNYHKELAAKKDQERVKAAEKNRQAGEAFLAANKKKAGVKTHSVTLPDGKTAELQYKVITEGTGAIPKSNDMVTVNYRGTLIDGKEFDSSAKNGAPLKRPANQLIRGWTEVLQMMKVGSKWEVYLPSTLAYGDRPAGPLIEPGSALVFEVDLVGIDTPQPLTSDIIRVPSAEELKAGAKIEVLKPEDVEKQTKGATNKASKQP